ncbi:hypothetical protein [Pseudomonas sp. C2B4]|uniref:hypothetical protein n=1 Tax=Pseudomonas sp. C2B4 TaxID=2735270 RepID=UPI001586B8AB|nr:hypothetical protein [Pseudomonas sp. C2B4]NUU36493.1 hypothetical protein [Pseudomonas sp. C2B4]
MPLQQTTKDLLAKYFGNMMGPDDASYDAAVAFSRVLTSNGVNSEGVIAVCLSAGNYWYFAVSPDLQRNIKTVAGTFGVTKWIEKAAGIAVAKANDTVRKGITGCTTTSDAISEYRNPGCAEKKIIHQIHDRGATIAELSLVVHPLGKDVSSLTSYETVGDRYGSYITPCSGCIGAADAYCAPD